MAEEYIAAIQDHVIATKVNKEGILVFNIENTKCCVCVSHNKEETLEYLMAGSFVIAPKQYLAMHNKDAAIIHQRLKTKCPHQ